MSYRRRLLDDTLDSFLPHLAAVAIEGAKGVGKTATAQQRCRTEIALDDPLQREALEVNLGLIPGFGGTQRLLRLAGRAATLELCLTGTPVGAERALQLGIVNRVVPAAELQAETMKLATQLAASAPLALRGLLDCVNIGGECGIEEGLEYEAAQFGLVFSTEDMREGTRAFLDKRKPVFNGK